jgi:hypothetical protein
MKVMLEVDGNIKPKENDILICGKNNVWYVTSKDEFLHELTILRHEFDEKVESDGYFDNRTEANLNHCNRLQKILAKSIYDNFVDRGLIENDDDFQQAYYDFIFSDMELDFEQAPAEFKAILNKVESL